MRRFMIARGFEDKDIVLPKRGTAFSAGYDFRTIEEVKIEPGEKKMVSTGVKAQMEDDDVLLVVPRSSVGVKKGIRLANTIGVIDADYFNNPQNDGHIMICLENTSKDEVVFPKGERIAQGIFVKYEKTDDDDVKVTRQGGYGSTGRK